jgi:hypothetical protein
MVVYITEESLWAGPTREKRGELVGGTHPWLVVFCERCLWAGPTLREKALKKKISEYPLTVLKP